MVLEHLKSIIHEWYLASFCSVTVLWSSLAWSSVLYDTPSNSFARLMSCFQSFIEIRKCSFIAILRVCISWSTDSENDLLCIFLTNIFWSDRYMVINEGILHIYTHFLTWIATALTASQRSTEEEKEQFCSCFARPLSVLCTMEM